MEQTPEDDQADISFQRRLCQALKNLDLAAAGDCLKAGADPDYEYDLDDFNPPMHEAAAANFVAGLQTLVDAGASVDSRALYKQTPLMTAASHGSIEAGRWLMRHGAKVAAVNLFKETALSLAVVNDHLEFAEMMLQEVGSNAQALLEETARRSCSTSYALEAAHWLLQKGVSPNLSMKDGKPWLLTAIVAQRAAERLVDTLLKAGANPNGQAPNGETPLHKAVTVQSLPSSLLLLRAGADPDLVDQRGVTPRRLIDACASAELRAAFRACEASQAAQQRINDAISGNSPTPL